MGGNGGRDRDGDGRRLEGGCHGNSHVQGGQLACLQSLDEGMQLLPPSSLSTSYFHLLLLQL